MSIKKVLFVCSIYKPNIGGVEIAIEQTAKHLREIGIKSVILTKKFPKSLPEFEIIDDTPVHRIERPVSDSDFNIALKDIIKNESELRADIVHIIGIRRPMPLLGLLLAKKWRVPYLVTFAGGDLPQSSNLESQELWEEGLSVVKESVAQADSWTAFANHTSDLASSIFKDIDQPKVIYGGVDIESIKNANVISNDSSYFFTARRLEYSKGIDVLIKAFAEVMSKLYGYELIIAGDGIERLNLEKLADTLSVKVKFLGAVSHITVFGYMKGAVAHICPSRVESGGLVNYEAQAAGCVSIGSDVDGIPEYIIDNETGLLFKNENINDLSEKLLLVAKNNLQIQEIRKFALEESKKHGWNIFTDLYINLYDSLSKNYSAKEFRPWSTLTGDLLRQISN